MFLKVKALSPYASPATWSSSLPSSGKDRLCESLSAYKENELLFLHDKRVPANNSLCERLARVYKRKQKQAVTLRSQESLCYICDGLSVVYLLRADEENVYQKISEIYGRRRPPRVKKEAGTKV